MTEDETTAANAALLLDEKIEERIHIAIGRLFGQDVRTHQWLPRQHNTTTDWVRNHVTQELVRETLHILSTDTTFVRDLYERMTQLNHERRVQAWNINNLSQRHF